MNAASAQLLQELEQGRLALLNAVESVPRHLQDARPADNRWSVAEVLEHLSMVERRSNVLLKNVLSTLRSGTKADAGSPSAPASRGNFSKAALLDRTRKIKAVPAVEPTRSITADSSIEALEASRAELKSIVAAADDQVMASHAYDHPAFGALNVVQWIEFLVGHEARHTAQILEIALQLKESQ